MPENFERSAVQLYSKIGQEPFVLAEGIVGACVRVCMCEKEGRGYKLHNYSCAHACVRACVCVREREGRGGDTNYMIMI